MTRVLIAFLLTKIMREVVYEAQDCLICGSRPPLPITPIMEQFRPLLISQAWQTARQLHQFNLTIAFVSTWTQDNHCAFASRGWFRIT